MVADVERANVLYLHVENVNLSFPKVPPILDPIESVPYTPAAHPTSPSSPFSLAPSLAYFSHPRRPIQATEFCLDGCAQVSSMIRSSFKQSTT